MLLCIELICYYFQVYPMYVDHNDLELLSQENPSHLTTVVRWSVIWAEPFAYYYSERKTYVDLVASVTISVSSYFPSLTCYSD